MTKSSNSSELTEPNFGVIGRRRPITKTPPYADFNGNASQADTTAAMQDIAKYQLFGDSAPQQRVPFQQYQQPLYYSQLHSPTDVQTPPSRHIQNHYSTAQTSATSGQYFPQTPTMPGHYYPQTPMVRQSQYYQHPTLKAAPPQQSQEYNGWITTNNPQHRQHEFQLPNRAQIQNSQTSEAQPLDVLASALSSVKLSSSTSPRSAWSDTTNESLSDDMDRSDSEDDEYTDHPNKYPVEIEYHENRHCGYRRQPTRSGPKLKQQTTSVYDPMTMQQKPDVQHIKYYKKDLVRICRCGKYSQMDGLLTHGRSNDCEGYEIHYSQKCKWKAFDDFKTGKRVLIRLCKCYKPF